MANARVHPISRHPPICGLIPYWREHSGRSDRGAYADAMICLIFTDSAFRVNGF